MPQDELLIEETPRNSKPRFSSLSQLSILIGLVGFGFILAGLVQLMVAFSLFQRSNPNEKMQDAIIKVLTNPANANLMRWLQLASAFLMFFVPVFATAKIISRKSFAYLSFNKKLNGKQVMYVVGISVLALVLSMVLGELNKAIPISPVWAAKFKAMEDSYQEQVMAIASMKSFGEYLFVLVVIAFAPALFEEALFRGGLQQILTQWTKRPIVAILITSFIFSAVHMSYYGFLPRMGLGVILGIIFYYSKNIWLNILMHVLNNGISITAFYLYSRKGKASPEVLEPEISKMYGNIASIVLGLITVSALTYLLQRFIAESKKIDTVDPATYLKQDNNPFS